MTVYDAIVVGLGGAGSSAVFHLARGGARVLGLEQYGVTHPHGSSHGRTRIFRTAYSEGTAYVPLVRRAQELWNELARAYDGPVVRTTGGLLIGREDSATVAGALRSAAAYSLEHELLTSDAVRARCPQFRLRNEEVAVWDPHAGALFPENCIRAHSAGAVEAGAELHYGEPVRAWSARADGVDVRTASARYRGRFLALTAGAWTTQLTGDLRLPLEIERQFVFWFPPSDLPLVRPERMPVFIWDRGPGRSAYGLPDFGEGVKVGSGSGAIVARPGPVDGAVPEAEAWGVRDFVRTSLNGVVPLEREAVSCLYTNAPDRDFLLGRHPRHRNVAIVSACSGHGFKFASVIGEVVARWARDEEPGFDLSPFDPGRFAGADGSSPGRRRGRAFPRPSARRIGSR